MEILEPKLPGTLWATPGLLRDSFCMVTVIEFQHVFLDTYNNVKD